jgi:hypothetical protein
MFTQLREGKTMHSDLIKHITDYHYFLQPFRSAVLEVTRLHKPTRTPDECGDQCSECKTEYPCDTIVKIKLELEALP